MVEPHRGGIVRSAFSTVFDLPSEKEDEGEGDESANKGIFDVGEIDVAIGGGRGWVSFDDEGEVNRRGGGKSEVDGKHIYRTIEEKRVKDK